MKRLLLVFALLASCSDLFSQTNMPRWFYNESQLYTYRSGNDTLESLCIYYLPNKKHYNLDSLVIKAAKYDSLCTVYNSLMSTAVEILKAAVLARIFLDNAGLGRQANEIKSRLSIEKAGPWIFKECK